MAVPYTTDYTDYAKYNELAESLKKDQDAINHEWFNNSEGQGNDEAVSLAHHYYYLNTKLNRTKHAIDSVNYALQKFNSYFDDLATGEGYDSEDLKDTIDPVPLVELFMSPKSIENYKVKDLNHLLSQIPDQYITVRASLKLPAHDHKVNGTNDGCLTVTIFVQSEIIGDINS